MKPAMYSKKARRIDKFLAQTFARNAWPYDEEIPKKIEAAKTCWELESVISSKFQKDIEEHDARVLAEYEKRGKRPYRVYSKDR